MRNKAYVNLVVSQILKPINSLKNKLWSSGKENVYGKWMLQDVDVLCKRGKDV